MSVIFKYAANNEAKVYESVSPAGKGVKPVNYILLGTWIQILGQNGDWFQVKPFGTAGWMHKNDLTDDTALKVFYLDVGQGDGCLIEIGDLRILIDAGPADNMYNYLTKWQYKYLLDTNQKIHIDYLFISHFDKDHFSGFTKLLFDGRFTVGQIGHPGILKFAGTGNPYNTGLGSVITAPGGKQYLTKIFDDLTNVNEPAQFNSEVKPFIAAVKGASAENRLSSAKRFHGGDVILAATINNQPFKIEALGPFSENINGQDSYIYFDDESHTINGHSLVLKLTYGNRTYLFGGDSNEKSENYMIGKYGALNPFEVDVTKSCHHGSQDFSVEFMKKMNPFATVISSGDNESYSHPRADAIGCSGRYSRGVRPLVFSTELARSTNIKSSEILFGMINSRCDGERIFFSQMKEVHTSANLWDSYEI